MPFVGHLYCNLLKETLQEYLLGIKQLVQQDIRRGREANFNDSKYIKKTLQRPTDPAKKLEYFMATGNLVSTTGLDLMQATGFCVVADKLNFFRYVSHFR